MATVERTIDDEVQALFALDRELIQDPYPLFRRLRDESPLHRLGDGSLLVSRHADVKTVLRDPRRFPALPHRGSRLESSYVLLSPEERRLLDEVGGIETNFMAHKNGDEHRRVRGPAQRLFAPKAVAELERLIQEIADEALDGLAGQSECDLIPIAFRLPLLVATELMGAPREDADQLARWGATMVSRTAADPVQPDMVRSAHDGLVEFREYVRALAERHRRDPEPTPLIAAIAAASADERLSELELVAMYIGLLFAGHETTTNIIGNGLAALLGDPPQWEALKRDRALIPDAIEEMLRYEPPLSMLARLAADDTELEGVPIAAGTTLLLFIGSANRDPRAFPEPDRFDVRRAPRDHIAFGYGEHFCLGAPIARAELRIVFETLIRRFPDLRLAVARDELMIRPHRGLRGLSALPLRLA